MESVIIAIQQDRKKIRAIIVALLLSILFCPSARATGVDHAFQWWTPVYLDAPLINPKVRLYAEANPRLNDGLNGMNQLLLRTALGYKLRKNIAFYQGYAYINNFLPTYVYENRIYQQLGVGHVIKKRLQVLHRFRSEQRMFQTRSGVSNRLRYMLRLAYPIRNTYFYLVAYDELFVNVNSLRGGPEAGIDQNRLFAGIGRQINEKMRAEIGYQLQYINRSDPFDDRGKHVLLTQVFLNF